MKVDIPNAENEGVMIVILVLLIVGSSLLFPGRGAATPYAHAHERVVVLGSDDSTYYNLRIRRVNHGSYYMDTDSTFLERWSYRGTRIERLLIRVTVKYDSSATGRWIVTDKIPEPPNIATLLASRKLWYAMPVNSETAHEFERLRATRGGLWLFAEEDSIELAKLEYGALTKGDLEYGIWGNDVLIDQFEAEKSRYLLAVVRGGEPEGDTNSTEVIVPVYLDYVFQVLVSWDDKRGRNDPDPRPRSRKR